MPQALDERSEALLAQLAGVLGLAGRDARHGSGAQLRACMELAAEAILGCCSELLEQRALSLPRRLERLAAAFDAH
jgi:hypothetical protein